MFLLGYAADPGFRSEEVEGIADEDLWSSMAFAYTQSLERALRRGVLQGYRVVEEALPTVRGRIDLAAQLTRRPGVIVPVLVRYDDLVVDTPENRLLRAAVRRLLELPRIPDDQRVRLTRLDSKLAGAQLLHRRDPLPAWRPTRLNQRYQPTLRLADVILRNLSVTPGAGTGLTASAFVVDMAKVFEDFVTVALQEARSTQGLTSGNKAWA